jgi:hippurate hydrolase
MRVFKARFGEANIITKKPTMGGEDFGEYGRTADKIPICMFFLGGVDPVKLRENSQSARPLPSLHSALWAPLPEPSIKTGVAAMTTAVLEVMANPK